ncbi:hypothetical protein FACS189490_08140 [Clostridia bacterium]|nr:hypothetical protein FACS189490_08140 [Clostridia bacterium]
MDYIQASSKHLEAVFTLTQDTIRAVYPDYYPKEVVDFFCSYHSREAIQADIEGGNVWVLFADGVLAGTGSREDNQIKRVFVSPAFQGNGYGSFIMQQLEDRIGEEYDEVLLDSSLCAVRLYEKRGYHTVSHEKLAAENGAMLVYIIMKKDLPHTATAINYEGKRFASKANTTGGDVGEETVFRYHQSGDVLWANYEGGSITKGFLVGIAANDGVLDFYYQHVNEKRQVRIGKCHSVPRVLENGKLELHEQWQWLDGDYGTGSSMIEEI